MIKLNKIENAINPDFIASVYEKGCGNIKLLDAKSGKSIIGEKQIVYADSLAGYMIESIRQKNGPNKFVIHQNLNFVIVK